MRQFLRVGMLIGCLLIGSFYPRMILDHHRILVDETGKKISIEGEYPDLPVEFQFRFLQLFTNR